METGKVCSVGAIASRLWTGLAEEHAREIEVFWGHDIDMNMSAEAEGARLLAEVEEEGLDEVSFFAGNGKIRSPIFSAFGLKM